MAIVWWKFINLPPTSVTIQSGVAKLIIANISAAIKNDALIVVNRSILYCVWLSLLFLFSLFLLIWKRKNRYFCYIFVSPKQNQLGLLGLWIFTLLSTLIYWLINRFKISFSDINLYTSISNFNEFCSIFNGKKSYSVYLICNSKSLLFIMRCMCVFSFPIKIMSKFSSSLALFLSFFIHFNAYVQIR